MVSLCAPNSKTRSLRARRGVLVGLLLLAVAGLAGGCGGAGSNGGGNGGGDDRGGDDGGGSDTTPPAAPAGLAADAADGAVGLSWDAVDDADAYRVYRSTDPTDAAGGNALESGLSATTYDDPSVTNGTTYYYRVTAVDEAGNESDGSSEVAGTPFAAPTGLAGTSGDAQVQLGWNAAAGAREYNVYRSTSPTSGATGNPLTTAVAGTTYVDETPENGTKYYYRVTAVNPEDEESSASNEVGKTPFSEPPSRP
jgi:fibronectin type 3 domain-containing protein